MYSVTAKNRSDPRQDPPHVVVRSDEDVVGELRYAVEERPPTGFTIAGVRPQPCRGAVLSHNFKFVFSRAICGAFLLELPNVGHERVDFRFG
jgi:hypothetical protein